MKKRMIPIVLAGLSIGIFLNVGPVYAQEGGGQEGGGQEEEGDKDKKKKCKDPEEDPDPNDLGTGDPAFLGVDPLPQRSLAILRKEAQKIESAPGAPIDLSAESGQWQLYQARLQENPKEAYGVVVDAWSQNFSSEFKKGMILKARGLITVTDELNNLDFMLDCLENPGAQRRKLLELARGNGLERNQAAARLSLMKLNPDLPSGAK